MQLAPITLFVYNRPIHTKKTIEALLKNDLASKSDLIIYSDGFKTEQDENSVQEVRTYVKNITGFRSIQIKERKENYGLAKSIIEGVTEIVNQYGNIIVLEDDLITSPVFLNYMNDALVKYLKEEKVVSVHGYVYPISGLPEFFFLKGADCWGWSTWKRGWDVFEPNGLYLLTELKDKKLTNEFDFGGYSKHTEMLENQVAGINSSWAIRWYASAFLKNLVTLYPGKSYIQNIGFGEISTHTKSSGEKFTSELNTEYKGLQRISIRENKRSREKFRKYFLSFYPEKKQNLEIQFVKKLLSFVKKFFK